MLHFLKFGKIFKMISVTFGFDTFLNILNIYDKKIAEKISMNLTNICFLTEETSNLTLCQFLNNLSCEIFSHLLVL